MVFHATCHFGNNIWSSSPFEHQGNETGWGQKFVDRTGIEVPTLDMFGFSSKK